MDHLELTPKEKVYLNGLLITREINIERLKEKEVKLYGEVPKELQDSFDYEERSIASIREKLLYF